MNLWTNLRRESDNGDIPVWCYGSYSVTAPKKGVRNRPHTEQKLDLNARAEWNLLPEKNYRFGLGARIKFGSGGSENDHQLSLYAGPLGSLWLSASGYWPNRFKPKGYKSRVAELRLVDRSFVWSLWAPSMGWSKRDRWYQTRNSLNFERLLLGRREVESETVDEGIAVIPMPEGNYPATYLVERMTWSYTKALGRLRDKALGKMVRFRTELEPGQGVPVPGKGENSWDLDDDSINSISVPGRSVDKAVAAMVESALKDRRRYGGQHMNV